MDEYYDDPDYVPYDETQDTDEVIYVIASDDGVSDHSESEAEGDDPPDGPPTPQEEPAEEDMQTSPPDSPERQVTLLTADFPQPFGEDACRSTPKKVVADSETAANNPKEESMEEDGQTCTICFEQWTNSSEHRLVSLRCGHLFGRSCITRWLKGQARCPQCNARARKSEIRNIYAKAVKVMDSTERDKALRDLQIERELRRKATMDTAQERLKHMMAVQECERLKRELSEANKMLQEFRSGFRHMLKSNPMKSNMSVFTLERSIEIVKHGGCRILDVNNTVEMALVTQPSVNELFPGYGVRKISTIDMKVNDYIWLHHKPIRDMAFHPGDCLVLTASLDKSVKISNMLCNNIVHTFPLNSDVWSCAWDADNPSYFYAGVKTGDVYLFDIRVTSRHVHELPQFGSKTPVVSLQYLSKTDSSNKCGPVVGKLSDCGFYQKENLSGDYKVIPIPTIGPFSSLSSEKGSGHFLVSGRPSAKQPRVTHTVCELVPDQLGSDVSCVPVHTILGGRTQVQLTRSKLMPHPENNKSLLICAGDEDANGALIWDGSSGKCLDQLRTESPVLDLSCLHTQRMTMPCLLALTDKNLRVYKWNSQ